MALKCILTAAACAVLFTASAQAEITFSMRSDIETLATNSAASLIEIESERMYQYIRFQTDKPNIAQFELSGALPNGLYADIYSDEVVISGSSYDVGSYAFTIIAKDDSDQIIEQKQYSLTVSSKFDDSQHADIEAVLTSHLERKIRHAGEVIQFAFNISNLTRSIPSGDYIRIDITAADVWRKGEVTSNVDFGFTCGSVGTGVPVGGSLVCSGSYTVQQADIEAGEILLAFGAALSTSQFALYGGTLMENFEVAKEETPKPETPSNPETPEKAACKPMPIPANGARFLFRYSPGAICS